MFYANVLQVNAKFLGGCSTFAIESKCFVKECKLSQGNADVLWANAKFLEVTQYFYERTQKFCEWLQSFLEKLNSFARKHKCFPSERKATRGSPDFCERRQKHLSSHLIFFPAPCPLRGSVKQHLQLISCECECLVFHVTSFTVPKLWTITSNNLLLSIFTSKKLLFAWEKKCNDL